MRHILGQPSGQFPDLSGIGIRRRLVLDHQHHRQHFLAGRPGNGLFLGGGFRGLFLFFTAVAGDKGERRQK